MNNIISLWEEVNGLSCCCKKKETEKNPCSSKKTEEKDK